MHCCTPAVLADLLRSIDEKAEVLREGVERTLLVDELDLRLRDERLRSPVSPERSMTASPSSVTRM